MKSLDDEQTNQIKDEVWRSYVNNKLIENEAKKLGLTVSKAEIQAIIDAGVNPIPQQTPFRNPQTGAFDKDMLKKLNEKYKASLAKKEKVQYCEIVMTFNLQDKTYGVEVMDVYGSKKTLLSHQAKELKFVPVPAGSFAEAMLEVCQQAVAADAQAAAK